MEVLRQNGGLNCLGLAMYWKGHWVRRVMKRPG